MTSGKAGKIGKAALGLRGFALSDHATALEGAGLIVGLLLVAMLVSVLLQSNPAAKPGSFGVGNGTGKGGSTTTLTQTITFTNNSTTSTASQGIAPTSTLQSISATTSSTTGDTGSGSSTSSTTTSSSSTSTAASPADFYVSPNGSDSFNGSFGAPFLSLQAAQTAVRVKIAGGMSSNVVVMMRGGNYFVNSTITFTNLDSGINGHQVVYENYPGEAPVLIGGNPVTNWQPYTNQAYQANVGVNSPLATIYENGERARIARFPSTGYLYVASAVNGFNSTEFTYSPQDVPSQFDYSHAQAYIFTAGNESADVINIKSIDFASHTITLSSPTTYPIMAGGNFALLNSLDFLKGPGEFAVNPAAGTLYYYPQAPPIASAQIIAPATTRLLDFQGSSNQPVSGIVVQGLSLQDTNSYLQTGFYPWSGESDGLVYLDYANGITIKDNELGNSGGNGVVFGPNAQGDTIYGNYIHDIGLNGVFLYGPWVSSSQTLASNNISDNYIKSVGQVNSGSAGILLLQSGWNAIMNNKIANVPRDGITLSSPLATGNLVEYNDISNVMTDTSDGGGIYLWHATGDTVQGNVVHDCAPDVPGLLVGLYVDDATNHTTLAGNVVYNLAHPNAFTNHAYDIAALVKGVDNTLSNNVLADNGEIYAEGFAAYAGAENDGLNLTDNVFYRATASKWGGTLYNFADWEQNKVAASDNNDFYSANSVYTIGMNWSTPAPYTITLSNWSTTYGFDTHSITADPQFRNPGAGDYTPTNPQVAALGFSSSYLGKAGLLPGFKFPQN